ncbi:hypothetical protein BA1_08681 [Bacillus xiamenensis]|nr:hypothetical protein BA1_08681 [Bacillus xiamenensis]
MLTRLTAEPSQRKAILKELLGACGDDVVFEGKTAM